MSSDSKVHRYLPRAVLATVVAAAVIAIYVRNDLHVLSKAVGMTQYTNGSVMVQVPYRRDSDEGYISVAVDFNADGTYDGTEQVVDRYPAQPRKYWNNNYYFKRDGLTRDRIRVKVVYMGAAGEEVVDRFVVPTASDDVLTRYDFQNVTKPELSMRQGTSDIAQREGECAPAVAANSLIHLAKQHGQDGRVPSDTLRMIDELKDEMRWTSGNGVLPDDYVSGSNLWAAKKGLAIKTAKVGNQSGTSTLDMLTEALAGGSAAQLRISFSIPDRGTESVIGGHLLTVVSINTVNDRTYVQVHDPQSPSGTDTYIVEDNKIVGYPFFADGETTLSWAFVQSWIQ